MAARSSTSPPKCTYLLTADIDGAGLPAITTPITLNGGKHTTIKRAAGVDPFRILTVNAGGDLTLNHLTITGGHTTGDGGGILVNTGGTLAVHHSTTTLNIASDDGGGIANNGTTTVTRSTVSHNTCDSDGCGIFNSNGLLTVSKSHVNANTGDGIGAGIGSLGGTVQITRSTAKNNRNNVIGGGVGLFNTVGVITATDIVGNTTGILGGGLWALGGQLFVKDVTVARNTAVTGNGGGLLIDKETTARIEDSLVKGNFANVLGGGLLNEGNTQLLRTKIAGNQAGGQGGGIFNSAAGTVRLFTTEVVKNVAVTDGGGIFNDGGTVELNTATGTIVVKNRPDNCAGDVPGCVG